MQGFWPIFLRSERLSLENRFVSAFILVGAFIGGLMYIGFFVVCCIVLFGGLTSILTYALVKMTDSGGSIGWIISLGFLSFCLVVFIFSLLCKIKDTIRFNRFVSRNTGHPVSSRMVYDWIENQDCSHRTWTFIKGIILFSDGVKFECGSRWAFVGIQRFCKKTYPHFQE